MAGGKFVPPVGGEAKGPLEVRIPRGIVYTLSQGVVTDIPQEDFAAVQAAVAATLAGATFVPAVSEV